MEAGFTPGNTVDVVKTHTHIQHSHKGIRVGSEHTNEGRMHSCRSLYKLYKLSNLRDRNHYKRKTLIFEMNVFVQDSRRKVHPQH